MGYQQLLTAGTGFIEVDGWIDPFFCQASLEVNFGVTCALELLVNYLVHAATRLYQGGAYDGQRAPFLEIAGRTKEALGSLQGISIHAEIGRASCRGSVELPRTDGGSAAQAEGRR